MYQRVVACEQVRSDLVPGPDPPELDHGRRLAVSVLDDQRTFQIVVLLLPQKLSRGYVIKRRYDETRGGGSWAVAVLPEGEADLKTFDGSSLDVAALAHVRSGNDEAVL